MAPSKAPTPSLPPSKSLYLQNLPEKIRKQDLQRELYMLFSTFGPVLDVTTIRTPKMRGQAHVLFRDMQCATQALRACQGMDFFGKGMKITYSKNISKTIAKLAGTAHIPTQNQVSTATEAAKPVGSLLPPPPSNLPSVPPPKVAELKAPAQAPAANAPSPGQKRPRDESEDEDEGEQMDEEDDDEGEMDMSEDD